MSLSERMNKAGGADKPKRHLAPVDGLSEFKVAISNSSSSGWASGSSRRRTRSSCAPR